jgi:hypothetical protein
VTWVTAGNILLVLATIPAVASVVVYAGVPWYTSVWGKSKMLQSASIAVVLVLGCVRLAFGEEPWFAAARTFSFALVVVALYFELYLYILARREGPTTEKEES